MVETQHTCPETTGMTLQAICEDGSVGASDVFLLIAGVLILGAIGWIVYNWTRKRFS